MRRSNSESGLIGRKNCLTNLTSFNFIEFRRCASTTVLSSDDSETGMQNKFDIPCHNRSLTSPRSSSTFSSSLSSNFSGDSDDEGKSRVSPSPDSLNVSVQQKPDGWSDNDWSSEVSNSSSPGPECLTNSEVGSRQGERARERKREAESDTRRNMDTRKRQRVSTLTSSSGSSTGSTERSSSNSTRITSANTINSNPVVLSHRLSSSSEYDDYSTKCDDKVGTTIASNSVAMILDNPNENKSNDNRKRKHKSKNRKQTYARVKGNKSIAKRMDKLTHCTSLDYASRNSSTNKRSNIVSSGVEPEITYYSSRGPDNVPILPLKGSVSSTDDDEDFDSYSLSALDYYNDLQCLIQCSSPSSQASSQQLSNGTSSDTPAAEDNESSSSSSGWGSVCRAWRIDERSRTPPMDHSWPASVACWIGGSRHSIDHSKCANFSSDQSKCDNCVEEQSLDQQKLVNCREDSNNDRCSNDCLLSNDLSDVMQPSKDLDQNLGQPYKDLGQPCENQGQTVNNHDQLNLVSDTQDDTKDIGLLNMPTLDDLNQCGLVTKFSGCNDAKLMSGHLLENMDQCSEVSESSSDGVGVSKSMPLLEHILNISNFETPNARTIVDVPKINSVTAESSKICTTDCDNKKSTCTNLENGQCNEIKLESGSLALDIYENDVDKIKQNKLQIS